MDSASLRGRAVVNVQQAQKIGTVDDVLFDLRENKIGGLVLQGGLFRGGPTVAWSEVRSVGKDAVMVDASEEGGGVGRDEEGYLTHLNAFRSIKVVTDTGNLGGSLSGADVDTATGLVNYYVVTTPDGGGLFRSAPTFTLPPRSILGVGPDLLTVDASVIETAPTAEE